MPCRVVQLPVAEQIADQVLALAPAERLEQDRRGVELPPSPAGAGVEESGASYTEEEDRGAAGQVRDVLDEVDEDRLRPLEVVDDDDLRPLGGACLQQAPKCDPRFLRGRGDDGLRVDFDRSEDLDERPVGDPLSVVQAAAAEDVGGVLHPLEEVGDEP